MKQDLYAIYSVWLNRLIRFLRHGIRLVGLRGGLFLLAFMGLGFGSGAALAGVPRGVCYLSFHIPGIIGMARSSHRHPRA